MSTKSTAVPDSSLTVQVPTSPDNSDTMNNMNDNNKNPASSSQSTSSSSPPTIKSSRQPARRKDRRITRKGRELQRKHLRENQTVVRWEGNRLLLSKAFRVGFLGVERTVSVTVPVLWKGVLGVVAAVSVGGLVRVWKGVVG